MPVRFRPWAPEEKRKRIENLRSAFPPEGCRRPKQQTSSERQDAPKSLPEQSPVSVMTGAFSFRASSCGQQRVRRPAPVPARPANTWCAAPRASNSHAGPRKNARVTYGSSNETPLKQSRHFGDRPRIGIQIGQPVNCPQPSGDYHKHINPMFA